MVKTPPYDTKYRHRKTADMIQPSHPRTTHVTKVPLKNYSCHTCGNPVIGRNNEHETKRMPLTATLHVLNRAWPHQILRKALLSRGFWGKV